MRTRSDQVCYSKNVGRDHISKLHESIITHILSRLPTKDAAQTSTLSSDWRFNWHSIDNVDITDAGCVVPANLWKYYTFRDIDMIFITGSGGIRRSSTGKAADLLRAIRNIPLSHNVRSFSVCWWGIFYAGQLRTWTSAALNPNTETFRLLYPWTCFMIPENLLECTSLKILELKVQSVWRVPAIVDSFSKLVDLYLHSIHISNEDIGSDTLVFKFKVLETLRLYHCKFLNVKFFEIHAPALTTFKWFCCHGAWTYESPLCAAYNSHLIKIFGAQLTCFEIRDSLSFLEESTIAYATLRCFVSEQPDNLKIQKLFERNVNDLMLNSNTINGIIIKQPNPLSSFHGLERLSIQFLGDLEGLLKLLQATPILRFLEIDRWTLDDGELETVPSCVTFFLEEIKFNWYSYCHHGFQLEKFLLKSATKLKKVTLQFKSSTQESEYRVQIEQLSTSPRAASASLQTALISKFNP